MFRRKAIQVNKFSIIGFSIVFVIEIIAALCIKKDDMNTREYLIFLCSIALAVTALVMIVLVYFRIV